MQKLAQTHRDKLIDLLNERHVFEREGVKIYDRVIEQMKTSSDPTVVRMTDLMSEHRDQEKEHRDWLEAQIRALGGDPAQNTERSDLILAESEGVEKVVFQDSSIPHLFHALLAAELVDNAGWELLLQLADRADDDEARRAFRKRLHEEEEHLTLMRQAVQRFARSDVLGLQSPQPSAP